MNRTIWTGVCVAVAGFATVAIAAQTSSTGQNGSADRRVTITGCLKQAPATPADNMSGSGTAATAGAAGRSGTAGAAGAAGTADATPQFVLADATTTPAATDAAGAAGSTAGTSGTTPGAASTDPASTQTYRLIANPTALSPHIGKKLELTGTIVSGSSAAGAASSSAAAGPALRVESGKVIATSCTQ